MPKLRDYFEKDLDTVIESNEFATEHDLDGKTVKCVLDNDTLKELQLSNGGEGLANSELLFHIKSSELDFTPFVDQDITFDKKLYYINSVQEDEGLYTIAIGVARS